MTTYSKNDRVTVELDGELKTLTITKSRSAGTVYDAVTARGVPVVITHDQIKGRA